MKKSALLLPLLLLMTYFSNAQSFDPVLAGKLQSKIDSMRTTFNVKGISACVIYPGVGIWKGVSGVSHAGVPISSDMEFGIASNTKLFTGVLLLKLAEHNIIHLDDSIHTYLPSYNHIDSNITIRQLLNHTSGLYDVTSVPGYPDSILNNPNRIFTPTELISWAQAPLFQAGTDWSYCNTNYLLAGMIAESATGKPFGQLLRDSILSPLQLDSTFLDVYDSVLYTKAHPWQAGVDNNAIPRKSLNSAAWAAGAMYSTSGEMAQWYQALMNGQVLNANSLHEMTTFVGTGNYGIGISKANIAGRTVWQHGGTIWGGYNSMMMYDTASGYIICVLINQLPAQANQVAGQLLSTLANNPVGMQENEFLQKKSCLYPNPAKNTMYIKCPSCEIQRVQLFNIYGECVLESKSANVNISTLPKGTYQVKVFTKDGSFTHKMAKD